MFPLDIPTVPISLEYSDQLVWKERVVMGHYLQIYTLLAPQAPAKSQELGLDDLVQFYSPLHSFLKTTFRIKVLHYSVSLQLLP